MRKSLCSLFLMALISSVLWLSPATAQVDRGSIVGTVKDSTNAVLPGARVELQQKGPSAVSDNKGQFMISNLPPGDYHHRVLCGLLAVFNLHHGEGWAGRPPGRHPEGRAAE